MASFAIVIGIDSYANPEWNLAGAVKDAVSFATWALESGGVEPANLRLLLGTTDPKPTDLPYEEATRRSIVTAVQEFQNGRGAGGEKLYFYYGGHGLSGPGAAKGLAQEPVLIPPDVTSIQTDGALLIGFSEIIPLLNGVQPQQQFFFVDACRDFGLEDFQAGLGRAVGPWMPSGADGGSMSAQFMLYATAPGKRAFEQNALGRGVFCTALLEGLRGKPTAVVWSDRNMRYEVRFTTLVEHVRAVVRKNIQLALPKDWTRYVQVPEPWTAREPDAVLAGFEPDKVTRVPIRVRVSPSGARATCQVSQLAYVPGAGQDHLILAKGPPAQATSVFDVLPGVYSFQARADSYATYREPCSAYEAKVIEMKLQPEPEPPTGPELEPEPELESFGVDFDSDGGDGRPADRGEPDVGPTTGGLTVVCDDPTAIIVVWDSEREVKAHRKGTVFLGNLLPGFYQIRMITVEGTTVERLVEVMAGPPTEVRMDAPGPRLGRDQMKMLGGLGIVSQAGYIHPSEHLDGFADARLASLLSLAAFAAQWPELGDLQRLRAFGVRSMADVPSGRAGLTLLVGASGEHPVPDVSWDSWLGASEYVALAGGEPIGQGRFDRLTGFPAASQAVLELAPGPLVVELRLPGLAATRYALTALPGRVTVLVAVAEDDGEVEVQQYMLPLRNSDQPYPAMASSNDIRRLDVAQRYYSSGELAENVEMLSDLLYGKWVDPLLGCLAGYALVRAGQAERFAGYPEPHADPDRIEPSAMQNMLKFFGGLPDSHVLAALCEPERRDEHFANAARIGLPVFAEGLRHLYAWYQERGEAFEHPVRVEPSALLPGSPWTAWVAARPALVVRSGSFSGAPIGWELLERKRAEIERTIPSVGRIESSRMPWIGTGFVVGPGLLMTSSVVVAQLAHEAGPGRWELEPGGEARVDFADEPDESTSLEFAIERVVEVDESRMMALLELGQASKRGEPLPPPLRLATRSSTPYEGRQVYVLGYPAHDPRNDPKLIDSVFGDVYGVKRLQPGRILAVSPTESILWHDCFTMGGNAGSPVVDLGTGEVIGLHYAGRWSEYKRGEATALWMPSAIRELLAGKGMLEPD